MLDGKWWLGALVPAMLCGCAAGEGGALEGAALGRASAALTAAECADLALDVDRSLVVHDGATLGAADFSLERTLQAIIDSSASGASATPASLLQSLIASFGETQHVHAESGLAMPVDARPGEAGLDASDLLDPSHPDFMEPVALFNRLDLAPASGSHCGEHRIVYAKTNNSGGRLFLIFEAALPNPDPSQGIAGCQPVADFWAQLSDDTGFPSAASRASALADFYYGGLPGFDPVVQHENYGVPFGQVRSNHFIDFAGWQLREWRTAFDGAGEPTFVVDTTKMTPLAEYYDLAFTPGAGSPFDPALFDAERAAFQADFIANQLDLLAAPELSGAPLTEADIVNGFGAAFPSRFDEYQSQASSDVPRNMAGSGFDTVLGSAAPPGLSAAAILNRAGAMTCGGCHQFSNDQPIGDLGGTPVRWPRSLGFVHVDEGGNLSEALTDFFLPARLEVLRRFACEDGGGEPDAPIPCGGILGDTCGEGEYCDLPEGECGGLGECAPRPSSCGPYGGFVCGCDGESYANRCEAARAGANVDPDRECAPPPCSPAECGPGPFIGPRSPFSTCRPVPPVCVRVPSGACRWLGGGCRPVDPCDIDPSRCEDPPRPPRPIVIPRPVPLPRPRPLPPGPRVPPQVKVESATADVLAPSTATGASEARALEQAVLEAREAERQEPGAFVPVRRVH